MLEIKMHKNYLYVYNGGQCLGEILADDEDYTTFAAIYGGLGDIIQQHDNPPNPFFVKSWGEVFANPEMLPSGVKNIFIDNRWMPC